jgi:putative addiction module component (TIGR02574 family)
MSPNAAQLLERALELSDDERAELIVRLLDTMSEGSEPNADGAAIEAAWIEEARRRLHEIKSGRVEPSPWSEARERIFAHEP